MDALPLWDANGTEPRSGWIRPGWLLGSPGSPLGLDDLPGGDQETISVSWKRRLRNSGVVVPLALAPSEPKSHSACSAMAGNRAPFAILTT